MENNPATSHSPHTCFEDKDNFTQIDLSLSCASITESEDSRNEEKSVRDQLNSFFFFLQETEAQILKTFLFP